MKTILRVFLGLVLLSVVVGAFYFLITPPVERPDLFCGGHPPCESGWNGMLPGSARVRTQNPYSVGDVVCVVSGFASGAIPSKTTVLDVYEDLIYVDGHMGPINHLHYEKCDD